MVALRHTLIVCDGKHKDREEESPSAEIVHQHRNEAVGVERGRQVGDLRIGRRRNKTRIDSHLGGGRMRVVPKGKGR